MGIHDVDLDLQQILVVPVLLQSPIVDLVASHFVVACCRPHGVSCALGVGIQDLDLDWQQILVVPVMLQSPIVDLVVHALSKVLLLR